MPKPTLTPTDFARAAQVLGCETASIRAVAEKESSGGGFLKGQLLTVRFEGHVFRRLTRGVYDKSHPTLSHPYMRNCPYNGGVIVDWRRLEAARKLAGDVAFECASYGRFQVMGFHYAMLGYDSAHALVQDFNTGEGPHLDGFVAFIHKQGLGEILRLRQFNRFALRYNGADAVGANNYGADIKKLYDYYSALGS